MDRARWLASKRAEVEQLRGLPLSEVAPSRRDFSLYVSTRREDLAVIARVQHTEPGHGSWPSVDLVAHAVACDEAEVAALAVATDAQREGSLALLRSVAEHTGAPVLRDDLTIHPAQLYQARLHGADAAVFPAAELDAAALADLVRVASSLHMAAVIEVQSRSDLDAGLRLDKTLIGINADVETARRLADGVPANRTVLLLRDPATIAAARELRGHVDAVVIGALLLDSGDVAATIAAISAL